MDLKDKDRDLNKDKPSTPKKTDDYSKKSLEGLDELRPEPSRKPKPTSDGEASGAGED